MEPATSIESIKETLRTHGLQVTSARIAVLQVLSEEHDHQSVEELRSRVLERYPAIDPATVYRTLETLEASGLAVRMELGDKRSRWASIWQSHHHMVCRSCRRVLELPNEPFRELTAAVSASTGVRLELQHLVLRGLCAECAGGGG